MSSIAWIEVRLFILSKVDVAFDSYLCIHFRFTYKFKAQTTGTMFYHSHVSHQRGDGNFGPYIVRQTPEDDPNSHLYDYDLTEHMIFPQEWFHEVSSTS